MTDALLHRNIGLAHMIAGQFFIPGGDYQDVHQEAMIALWIATETWDRERGPFVPFAALVIRRHLIDAVKMACRSKHVHERDSLIRVVVNGDPYKGDKRTDNAVQRARVKLRVALEVAA